MTKLQKIYRVSREAGLSKEDASYAARRLISLRYSAGIGES